MLAESQQALLYDRQRGTYVLANVGEPVSGYLVEDIADDEVTLSASGKEYVLAAPDQPTTRPAPAPAPSAARSGEPADGPQDPYGDAPDRPAPVDPYAEPAVRTAFAPAPVIPGEDGIRVTSAARADAPAPAVAAPSAPSAARADAPAPAVAALPAPSAAPRIAPEAAASSIAPSAVRANTPAPAVAAPPAPSAAPRIAPEAAASSIAPSGGPIVVSRIELDRGLSDFVKLSSTFRGTFTPAGVRLDMVGGDSLFAKAGLRTGDTIASVDGLAIRSLDDAANLYANAATARSVVIQVVRGGKPVMLRVSIQ
ncbi:MAG: PDZ domain-containing protein [Kofleriaceae bacterium]